MSKDYLQWLKQSDYDLNTANAMFQAERYFYAVFMCHLSIENAQGLLQFKHGGLPPKTHNLIRLLHKANVTPNESESRFHVKLNEVSVATRYPEDIEVISKQYDRSTPSDIIKRTKEALRWIKNQF